ncbi:hypothetical protein TELCIR_10376 [Teladorsagia circumcincta]|uniref:Beta-N-acetylhexosaminidase n=1 Tax=Teladorsagia circumcincta TaxID=45464 RepID=A0A2G9UDP7_TELCI|nr:hypothetical protein TELCIR_10376 [Teladorsagia circumcincta]
MLINETRIVRELNLEVIPLVQTFGHLEWILKYEEFRKYRDDDRYPQCGTGYAMDDRKREGEVYESNREND